MEQLAGITARTQSLGGPVAPDEVAQRWQLAYKRLKRIPFTPEEEAWWTNHPQSGGGHLPRDLGAEVTQMFSPKGAFPIQGGGAFSFEGLADKAKGFAQSDAGQGLIASAQGVGAPPDAMAKLQGLGDMGQGLMGKAQGLMAKAEQAKGMASALASGNLGALPKASGPSLQSFLESQGVPIIPVTAKKTPGDFLGNAARWWVKAAASPYLGTLVKLTFMVMFFLSYLESTPLLGSVLSVALDATLAGGRILVKILQKGVPALMGLIPLPYMQMSGVVLVSVVGMFVWTILAVISFSRQDFTSAIDSMLRIIPMPIGDALADSFLDMNRTWDQLNVKRVKLTEDVWNGLLLLQQAVEQIATYFKTTSTDAYKRVKSGSDTFLEAVRGIRGAEATATAVPTAVPVEPGVTPTEPVPVAQEIPTAVPVAPGEAPGEAPAPSAPPVEALPVEAPPPAVEPTAPPVEPVPPTPSAPPVEPVPPPAVEPPPIEPPPPAVEAPPAPPTPLTDSRTPGALSALDQLRGRKTSVDVGRGFRGGKTLSTKGRKGRKWTIRQLSARFSGVGLR